MRYLFPTGKGYQRKWLGQDVLSGVVIAAVSIPISMGYAQIAGLPAVYGLYGSLLPVILFALLSTSPQFIFGVDAAPAAMIGGVLGGMGIAMGSAEAERVVPVLTLLRGDMAAAVCPAAGGSGAAVRIYLRDGGIHQRHLLHHHSDAAAQAHGRHRRHR